MKVSKNVNSTEVYHLLKGLTQCNMLPFESRVLLYRFLDKLADSEEFELKMNREFSAIKLIEDKDAIQNNIKNKIAIILGCGFILIPDEVGDNWHLQQESDLFLSDLTPEEAKRIALDINVAFLMKATQRRPKTN